MYKMCEKLASDVSLKYLSPGEELSPDNLISVTDDDDVQVSSDVVALQNWILHMHFWHVTCRGFHAEAATVVRFQTMLCKDFEPTCRKCLLSTGGARASLMQSRVTG